MAFDLSQILEPKCGNFWNPFGQSVTINCVLVNRRPDMGMEFGSTKRNRRLVSGLPTDSPLFCF